MAYPYDDAARQDILRMIPPDGKVIGSFGCGRAATEQVLVAGGRQVHGVDIAPEAIETAAGRITTARLISPGDLRPWEPQSLDGLILADVIEHIPMAWDVLAELAKAVRPGGWVVISVPNMRSVHLITQFLVRGDWPEHPRGLFDATHLQVISHKRLARWCDAAGLRVERWFDIYDARGPRRRRFFRALDLLSLRLFHSWFMFQLQVVCRK